MASRPFDQSERLTPFWTARRKRLYAGFAGVALLAGAWSSLRDWQQGHALFINTTQSLPNWAFLIKRGAVPKRGDYIFFDPPHAPLVLRHFGANPALFGKIAYGVGGDVVTRIGRTYFVNGRQVAVAKPVSLRGEPLALGPVGRIPAGCYFVGSPHKDGFDSRYAAIGWPCAKRVVGTGEPIL